MNNSEHETKHYFDYLKKAKKELELLFQKYPELATLSSKELEIFEQLLTDKTMVTIAKESGFSISGVHFHSKNIYKKLNVSNRRQFLITYRDLC